MNISSKFHHALIEVELRAFEHESLDSRATARNRAREIFDAVREDRDRWRARCDVSSRDVERAGVTLAQCETWLAANGWTLGSHPENEYRTWEKAGEDNVNIWPATATDPLGLARSIAVTIDIHARDAGRAPHDVLEEMAAL